METLYAARDDRYKAIEQIAPKAGSLVFDLARDPDEKAPLSVIPGRVQALRRDLAEFVAQAQEGLHLMIDADPDHASVRVALRSAAGFERAYLMGQPVTWNQPPQDAYCRTADRTTAACGIAP